MPREAPSEGRTSTSRPGTWRRTHAPGTRRRPARPTSIATAARAPLRSAPGGRPRGGGSAGPPIMNGAGERRRGPSSPRGGPLDARKTRAPASTPSVANAEKRHGSDETRALRRRRRGGSRAFAARSSAVHLARRSERASVASREEDAFHRATRGTADAKDGEIGTRPYPRTAASSGDGGQGRIFAPDASSGGGSTKKPTGFARTRMWTRTQPFVRPFVRSPRLVRRMAGVGGSGGARRRRLRV